jgi:tetratricopeptide (TPR) repeat protein
MKMRWLLVVLIALIAGSACTRDPNVAKKRYLESGNRYFDRGKYKEASMMYRNALKKDLRYGDAYYRLGLTLWKLNDRGGSYRSFIRALDLLPPGADRDDTSAKTTDIYIEEYIAHPRPTEVEVQLNAFLKRPQVTAFDKLRVDGYISWRKGDLDSALSKFKEANDLRPNDSKLVLAYTKVLMNKGRFDEANKLAMDLIAKSKDFGPVYDVLYVEYVSRNLPAEAESIRKLKADNNPKNLEFRLQLAAHYYLLNRPDEAARIIDALVADKQTFPNAREKAGDFYTVFRNFDKAISYYRGGLNGSKQDWLNFQRKIADVLVAQGRRDEALALVDGQILKQYPKDPVALAQRATLWLEKGDPSQLQQATQELEMAVGKLPQNAIVRYNLGRAYLSKQAFDAARTQFKAAVDIQPDHLPARQGLIEIHLIKGEFAMALQLADETLGYNQRDLPTRLLRSQALQGIGRIDDARNDLQLILKQAPNSAEVMFRLGVLEMIAKNYPAATRNYEQCLKNAQNYFPCVVGAAEVYVKQQQFDKAIEFLSAQLQKNPERREVRLALANTFVLARKYEAAMGIYGAMLSEGLARKEPESADLHLKMAETARRMGNTPLAIEHFRRVQQLQPKSADAAVWLAILLHQTGKEAEAKQHYMEALQIQPDNPMALNNLAWMIADQGGDLDVALTYAQRAVQNAERIKPKNPSEPSTIPDEVSDTLAWIYLKKKLTPNALSIYDTLVARQPQNSTFRYHRGLALLQKGDTLQAKKELQTALLYKPQPDELKKINEALAKLN